MKGNNNPHYDDDEAEGIELAPSETSQDLLQYAQPPQPMQQQVIFPPRQFTPQQQKQQYHSSAHKNFQLNQHPMREQQNMSQSLLNLSDSVAQDQPLQQQQLQPSSLVKQLSDKVRSQAERLQKLESYKQLCEKRILDLDPNHPMPIQPNHLGQKQQANEQSNVVEFKRQLAIKEQDLVYTKQRNEKLNQEIDSLKKEIQQIKSTDSNEALRKEIQQNEQLQRQIQMLQQDDVLDKIKNLEDEKNALLDYIEENIEKSQQNTARQNDNQVDNERVKQLEYQNNQLQQVNENLKYSDAMQRQKTDELEEQISSIQQQHQEEVQRLQNEIQDLQKRYSDKCDEHTKILKQIDPNFQENTFGNFEELSQKLFEIGTLQKELDFSKEQFESTKTQLQKEKGYYQKIYEETEEKLQQVEEQLRQTEIERDQLWDRIQKQENEYGHADELMHDNDNLKKENEELQNKVKQLQENSSTLSQTLNETQQELENLINDHEKLTQEHQQIKKQLQQKEDQFSKYKNLNSDNEYEIQRLREEVQDLKKEQQRQRENVNHKQSEISKLNDQLYRTNNEVKQLKDKNYQLEREQQNLERKDKEKQSKQVQEFEATFEDLTKELRNVQGELTEKESIFQKVENELRQKLSQLDQMTCEKTELKRRLEDIQSEVKHLQTQKFEKEEKLKMQINKNEELLEELERMNMAMTQIKEEKENTLQIKLESEKDFEHTQRQMNKMTKICNRIWKNVNQLQKQTNEFNSEFKIRNYNKEINQSNYDENNVESIMMECDQVIYSLLEWVNQVKTSYRNSQNQLTEVKSELQLAQQRLMQIEQKYQYTSQEECELRDKEKTLERDLDVVKEKLRVREEEKREAYKREERIQKQNQQIKQQLDCCRKEQEKLLMQIKSLYAEKERLNEENKQRVEMSESDLDKVKTLEVKLQQVYQQKEYVLKLIERLQEAMPSHTLQKLFSEIIETIHELFRVEEESQECETNLLEMEGELRQYAKKETQGLLSNKVINLRKDVEKSRETLRQFYNQKEEITQRREQLEQELKCTEMNERRRNDVTLETEKHLTEAKYEISNLKKEIQFCNTNRKDLETALNSVQEEKKMLERELLTLRAQLSMKGTGKQSTMLQIGQAPSRQSQQNASLKHGDILFQNNDSLVNRSEQKQQNQMQKDGFSSAEKNQRVMFTNGMNSARNHEDAENIQPNNNYSFDNQQHYKSFQSMDQPLQMQRPPMPNYQQQYQNNFKRPLSNRSGSVNKLHDGSFRGTSHNNESQEEELDEKEYPIRASLKKKLSQVKHAFSAIRQNLQDQNESQENAS